MLDPDPIPVPLHAQIHEVEAQRDFMARRVVPPRDRHWHAKRVEALTAAIATLKRVQEAASV